MNSLYITCQAWQLNDVRTLLNETETVGTDSYCFRPNTYVIEMQYSPKQYKESEDRRNELAKSLIELGINVPMQ